MFSSLLQSFGPRLYRPTASAGTITNAALAYDVDSAPWSTEAIRTTVTGSAVSGTPDTVNVVWNGFAAISKVGFTTCNLQIVLDWTGGSSTSATGTPPAGFLPFVGVQVAYRANGGTYTTLAQYSSTINNVCPAAGSGGESYGGYKIIVSASIPSSAFTANLSNLDIQTSLTTLTWTNGTYSFTTFGSYSIWDIQVNLT